MTLLGKTWTSACLPQIGNQWQTKVVTTNVQLGKLVCLLELQIYGWRAEMTRRQLHHRKLTLAHGSWKQLHRSEGVSSRQLSLSESVLQQSLLLIYAWEERNLVYLLILGDILSLFHFLLEWASCLKEFLSQMEGFTLRELLQITPVHTSICLYMQVLCWYFPQI